MTELTKPITRATVRPFKHYRRKLVITLLPGTESRDELVAFRLKGTRQTYHARLADLYTKAAEWHAAKVAAAKRQARKDGVPWRRAKRSLGL